MLTIKEKSLVSSLSNLGFDLATTLHMTGCKAIAKAYSNKEDGGEFARAIFEALPVYVQEPFARWLKRHGMNVAIDGRRGEKSIIGGVLDPKKADRNIRGAKEDAIILPLVSAHVPAKKDAAPVDLTEAQAKDVAKKKLAKFITSTKEKDEKVGAALNELIQRPAWFQKLEALNLTPEEVDMIVVAIMEERVQLKLAA